MEKSNIQHPGASENPKSKHQHPGNIQTSRQQPGCSRFEASLVPGAWRLVLSLVLGAWCFSAPAQVGPYVYNGGVPVTPPVTAYAAVAAVATNLTPRLGFIGSNTRIDNNVAPTVTYFMNRSFIVNDSGICETKMMIILGNGYDPSPNGTGWVGPGGTAYCTAAIEWPTNVFTKFTWNGVGAINIPSGQVATSDLVTLTVPIPIGAMAYERNFFSNGVGGVVFGSDANQNYQYQAFGGAVSDMTMGGNVGQQQANLWNPPVAVIGFTLKPSILMVGDSRTRGIQDNGSVNGTSDQTTTFGQSRILDASCYGQCNLGSQGETWANTLKYNWPVFSFLTNYATAVYAELGINDIGQNQTAFYVETNYSMFASSLPCPLYACTFEPEDSSIDGFRTIAGQSFISGPNANRIAFNRALRNNLVAGIANFDDLAACVESWPNSGYWAVNGTSNWLTADGVHCSITGDELEAASIFDFFNGQHIQLPNEGGFSGPLSVNGDLTMNDGGLVWRSNTFTVFALTNSLHDGDAREMFSNGPNYTGAWVKCLWSNGVPITNYAAGSGGGVLP